jgi:hypothetical protein
VRDPLNELRRAIEHETCRVIAIRFNLENERRNRMAIEIKGLKADALTARANLDKLRAAYAKFNEAAPAHAADVEGLTSQIGGMQSDLEFAATVMGNSAGESEKLAQTSSARPGTDDRVALGPHPDHPQGVQEDSERRAAIVADLVNLTAEPLEVATAPLSDGSAASTDPQHSDGAPVLALNHA